MGLNTAIIYGSARQARQGIKAARFVTRMLEQRGHTVTLIDSEQYDLPMLDRMYKEYDPGTAPADMTAISEALSAADGLVIVSAEYNHSVPAALKNLLDHFQVERGVETPPDVLQDLEEVAGVLRRRRHAASER